MKQIYENRKIKLGLLKKRFRYWANINDALGLEVTNPRLSRIYSGAIRTDTKKPYVLGEQTARNIEIALKLPLGWMDTPATYADLNGEPDPKIEAHKIMESIPEDKWPLAMTLLKALAAEQPGDDAIQALAQSIKPAKFG